MNQTFIDKIKKLDRFKLLDLYQKTDLYTVEALKEIEKELQTRELDFEAHDYAHLQKIEDEANGIEHIDIERNLDQAAPPIELYSQIAIWGFSLFFSAFFGAVLLMINLRRLNKPQLGYQVLLIGGLYMIASNALVGYFANNLILSLVLSILGAYLIGTLFWNRYIGKSASFTPRSITTPLGIGIILSLVAYYALMNLQ